MVVVVRVAVAALLIVMMVGEGAFSCGHRSSGGSVFIKLGTYVGSHTHTYTHVPLSP